MYTPLARQAIMGAEMRKYVDMGFRCFSQGLDRRVGDDLAVENRPMFRQGWDEAKQLAEQITKMTIEAEARGRPRLAI